MAAHAPAAPAPPPTPELVTGRRRGLPTGRAVTGGLLVAIAAIGTFAAWSGASGSPGPSVVVAAADLPAGRRLTPADLVLRAADLPEDTARQAFGRVEDLVGQATLTPVAAGELVQRSVVRAADSGPSGAQVSFRLDRAAALAGTLEDGETVDVLVTYAAGAGTGPTTQVAAEGAQVAAIADGGDLDADGVVVLLTLPEGADARSLATAVATGDLLLVRRSGP